jgi:hypothetical protein
MQCPICKEKPATVHLTQIVGDKMQKLDLYGERRVLTKLSGEPI